MPTEYERIKEAYIDMLSQACGEWVTIYPDGWKQGMPYERKFKGYDSLCLRAYAYRDALDLAVELGWIKKDQVLR